MAIWIERRARLLPETGPRERTLFGRWLDRWEFSRPISWHVTFYREDGCFRYSQKYVIFKWSKRESLHTRTLLHLPLCHSVILYFFVNANFGSLARFWTKWNASWTSFFPTFRLVLVVDSAISHKICVRISQDPRHLPTYASKLWRGGGRSPFSDVWQINLV